MSRPLLSNRTSSEFQERDIAEEDALLTGKHTERRDSPWKRWREIGLLVWAVIATAGVVVLAVVYQKTAGELQQPTSPATAMESATSSSWCPTAWALRV